MSQIVSVDSSSSPTGPLLIRAKEVAQLIGVSDRTIYRWVDEDNFPKPVMNLGVRRWRRRDIELWIEVDCSMRRFRSEKRG